MIRLTLLSANLLLTFSLLGCMAEPTSSTSSEQNNSSTASSAQASGDIALGRAYFMQSTTQGDTAKLPEQQVPLAAGKTALLRTFITGTGNSFDFRATALFHYQLPSGEEGSLPLSGPFLLPRSINEIYLSETHNASIPAHIVQPGIRFYLSVTDSEGRLETNPNNNRFPASGWAQLPVLSVPTLDLVVVPIVTKNISPNLEGSRLETLLEPTRELYPIAEIHVEIKPTVTYEGESWPEMLKLVENIQIANEETHRYYLGLAGHPLTFDTMNITAGYAYIGRKVATSLPYPDTIAHELGHNFGRDHAPCGDAPGADTQYPYPNGEIGVYGLGPDGLRFNDSYYDVMSYCSPVWISDYTYDAVIKALATESEPSNAAKTTLKKIRNNSESFVVNGHVDALITPSAATIDFIWPATKSPSIQHSVNSEFMAVLLDSNGERIASVPFTPYAEDHGDGLHFTVALTATADIEKVQILYRDTLLTERTIDIASENTHSKATPDITAIRQNENWVTLTQMTELPAVIRDADRQILTITSAPSSRVFTQSNLLWVNDNPVRVSSQ